MDDLDRDVLVLQDYFPDAPVDVLEAIYMEVVHDPLRVMFVFMGADQVLLRVFLAPERFYEFMDMQLKIARDLQDPSVSE